MNTRQRLTKELMDLRIRFKTASEEAQPAMRERGIELKALLNNMCAQCNDEPRTYNDHFCSKECNDEYWVPTKEEVKHAVPLSEKLKWWKNAKAHYGDRIGK